ncbi:MULTISPECIES: hypothetical protein [unclassified Bradyrhizobium]|uniref:hypothetical protein n=1 Tax=unclassified Bradyrhizobium TaxID=2631580 RepID=UPI001BA9C514|nr:MULTISPECIES: hypothetical protein [unclassified Bradyrhizobium]MBR1208475.1 hypothetical protein [Bradyrhizobium sp. AUGA SZCCT0124]MBR1312656.1 hypothetical protein [Bradyrhizobium sp. AUGA SZCCT0051]MBR1341014.1 hypothetical protein [Bradyrhizobium sp. AUGA SZCCT0105]MBR1359768.1 hypothetical protein [Bradyrhizobium sp. AUGA SZCCT0045]
MNRAAFTPLQNTALPHSFRQVRLERAREHDHPEGASAIGYIIVAPLDTASQIDVETWKAHREACRVVRQRPAEDDQLGHLVHGPGGSWRFHYDVTGSTADEAGYHFGNERFRLGEYVSVREADGMHPYRVVAVTPL